MTSVLRRTGNRSRARAWARGQACVLIMVGVAALGCGSDSTGPLDGLPPLDPALADGVELDVSYGAYQRNVLDIWIADPDTLTPLVVFIHGGGFVSGSKESLGEATRTNLLAAGISVAAINYRLTPTDIMPAPMIDAGLALQFLRDKGAVWRIDPERVGTLGGSAGGAISMWLCTHIDLARPESPDPVARQSSRPQAVAPSAGQSSLDPEWMKEWLPGGTTHLHPFLLVAFGVETHEQLEEPGVRTLIEEMSAINHVTADDCPMYMTYGQANEPLPPDATPAAGIHHPMFGIKMKEALDAVGVEAVLRIQNVAMGGDPYGSPVKFFEAKLSRAYNPSQ